MTTKRHLVLPVFMMLALGIAFTAGWAGNSAACDPADCASACKVMTAAECKAVCPPECVVVCEEVCADVKQASLDCAPGCGLSACAMGANASGTLVGINPAGMMSLQFASGYGAEIMK
jgi:hypothetical protein